MVAFCAIVVAVVVTTLSRPPMSLAIRDCTSPGAGPGEERQRHLLQVLVDGGAQVVHHALADDVRHVRLPHARRVGEDRDRDHRQHGHGQHGLVVLEDPDVERLPEQERLEDRDAGRDDDQREHGREPEAVGPEQRQDPAGVALARRVHQRRRLVATAPRSERIAPVPPAPCDAANP